MLKETTPPTNKRTINFEDIEWWAPSLEDSPTFKDSEVVFTDGRGNVLQRGILKNISLNNNLGLGSCVIEGLYVDRLRYKGQETERTSWNLSSEDWQNGHWTIYVNISNDLRMLAQKLLTIKGIINV